MASKELTGFGVLRGITDIGSGRLFIVKPYGPTAIQPDSFSDFHSRKTPVLSRERGSFRLQPGRAGQTIILGRRSLVDVQTVVIAMVTFGLLSFKKVPESVLILVAGAAGPLLFKG